jgi:hypothetical protein
MLFTHSRSKGSSNWGPALLQLLLLLLLLLL